MSEKKKVQYIVSDGVRPAVTPWGVSVRCPVEFEVPPNQSRVIELGIVFDAPAIVCVCGTLYELQVEGRVDVLVGGARGGQILPASTPIRIRVRNRSNDSVMIQQKEAVVDIVFVADTPEVVSA